MQFVKTSGQSKGTRELTKRLNKELSGGKRVLWLLSGGSNIAITTKVMAALPHEATKNLAIFLLDERYGETGHLDSNAKQLYDAGFQAKEAVFVPVLVPGFSLEETRERYAEACKRALEHADVVIAQIGIGSDGHIAGILPHSAAADADGWVAAYQTPHFTRVTLTFDAMRKITVAYVMAFGKEKEPTLLQLRDEKSSLIDQPAQFLKELPEVYIYNDRIGDKT
jgi:6-phosphogluconolactonase/glucosamine-6-phosphate isomerase/deaminase